MAGALEIVRAQRQAEQARKNAGGAPSNKVVRPTAQTPPRLPGLPLASSRFSSKGARGFAIEAKLEAKDFEGITPSGQQDRYTIEDVQAIAKAKRDAEEMAREAAQ